MGQNFGDPVSVFKVKWLLIFTEQACSLLGTAV